MVPGFFVFHYIPVSTLCGSKNFSLICDCKSRWRAVQRVTVPQTMEYYQSVYQAGQIPPTPVVSQAKKYSRQLTDNVSFEAIIGLSITPHILRHTYITNLLIGGADIKTVQYLAGHERATITLDIYAHLTYNRPEEILPKVNLAFYEG